MSLQSVETSYSTLRRSPVPCSTPTRSSMDPCSLEVSVPAVIPVRAQMGSSVRPSPSPREEEKKTEPSNSEPESSQDEGSDVDS